MTTGWVLAALVVPWVAGAGLVSLASDRHRSWLLVIGAGWLAGQVMVAALLDTMLRVTGSSHSRYLLAGLAVFGGVLWWRIIVKTPGVPKGTHLWHRRPAGENTGETPVPQVHLEALRNREQTRRLRDDSGAAEPPTSSLHPILRALLVVIAVSLVLKLGMLAVSATLSPIRGDDAISIWLFKAKVIAGLDTLVLEKGNPYYLGGSNPRYPLTVPLMAAWIPLITGHWNEQQATLPWLGFYVSVTLLVAGGLRRWLTSASTWIVAYIVASLPLVVIHAYRPGYTDLPMAALLAATVLYLLNWRTTLQFRHLALAALFAVGAACTKREAPLVVGVAVLVILLTSWRNLVAMQPRFRVALLGLMAVSVALVAAVVDVADVTDNMRSFTYNAEVWPALGRHLLTWSSFGFLFYGLGAAGLLVLWSPQAAAYRWPALLLLLCLFALDASAFLFTPQARFALNDQTPSRLFLQSVPAVILALAIPTGAVFGSGNCSSRR